MTIDKRVEQILEKGAENKLTMHVVGEIKALKYSTNDEAEGMKNAMAFAEDESQISLELISIRQTDSVTFQRLYDLCVKFYPHIMNA